MAGRTSHEPEVLPLHDVGVVGRSYRHHPHRGPALGDVEAAPSRAGGGLPILRRSCPRTGATARGLVRTDQPLARLLLSESMTFYHDDFNVVVCESHADVVRD